MSPLTESTRLTLANNFTWSESVWNPSMIQTALWLDAADASTVTTVSGGVSQWNDKSGNARHATQVTSGSRPTVAVASQNSRNGISFDGVDDRLGFSSALLGATHSLFILFKPTLEATTGTVFGQWQAGQTGRYIWNANQECSTGTTTSGRFNLFNASTTGGACTGAGGGFTIDVSIDNTATLISSISTTGSEQWKLLKNGTEWDSATITSVFTGVNSSLGSVNAADGSAPYDGVIYEVIHLASYASPDTRQRIEGYLAWKWGLTANLPAGHPYKTIPPTTSVQDEYRNNVSLLLHGNGTNGSTVITDSGPLLLPVTAVGNAQISTAQSKFGGASIALDGAGSPMDRLTIPTGTAGLQFGAGDFTIECWVYRLDASSNAVVLALQGNLATPAGSSVIFYVSSSGNSDVYSGSSTFGVVSPNPPLNEWAHIALVRSGTTLRSFLNGSVVGTNASLGSAAINDGIPTYPNTIGSFATNTNGFNGYIDDVRITKGVARYTANFTPPTAQFPDF